MNDATDCELMARSRRDPDCFGVVYERHSIAVFRFLARRVGAPAAEDLVSEVFTAAFAARKRFVGHASNSALPWLYGISGNIVSSHLRRRPAAGAVELHPGVDWDAVDARIDAAARRQELRAALNSLSPAERGSAAARRLGGLVTSRSRASARPDPHGGAQPPAPGSDASPVLSRFAHRKGPLMDLDLLLHDTAHVPGPTTLPVWDAPVDRRHVFTPLRVSVAAALVAAAVIVPTLPTGSGRPAVSAEAAQALHRAAIAAGAQPDGGWQGAKYWYSKSTTVSGGQTSTREVWIGHHAIGVLSDSTEPSHYEALDVALFPAGGSSFSWDELWSLPTDPIALGHTLRAGIHGAGNGDDSEMFVIIGDLLRESPAPPKLRAALYEVAGRIPGVRYLGAVTDQAGRPGMGVARGDSSLYFSTTDGRLLEETEGLGFQATYLEQGPRDSAPAPTRGNTVQDKLKAYEDAGLTPPS